jgi:hypothetical protein
MQKHVQGVTRGLCKPGAIGTNNCTTNLKRGQLLRKLIVFIEGIS